MQICSVLDVTPEGLLSGAEEDAAGVADPDVTLWLRQEPL